MFSQWREASENARASAARSASGGGGEARAAARRVRGVAEASEKRASGAAVGQWRKASEARASGATFGQWRAATGDAPPGGGPTTDQSSSEACAARQVARAGYRARGAPPALRRHGHPRGCGGRRRRHVRRGGGGGGGGGERKPVGAPVDRGAALTDYEGVDMYSLARARGPCARVALDDDARVRALKAVIDVDSSRARAMTTRRGMTNSTAGAAALVEGGPEAALVVTGTRADPHRSRRPRHGARDDGRLPRRGGR